jgi:hypothetical protein
MSIDPQNPDIFKSIEETLLKIPKQDSVNDNFYTFMHVVSQILLLLMHSDTEITESDIKSITLPDGTAAFSDEDVPQLYALLKECGPTIKELITNVKRPNQSGGGEDAMEKLIQLAQSITLTPDDISIDKAYRKLTEYSDSLDDQALQIARAIGPTAFISNLPVDPFIPLGPSGLKLQIPARSILPITNILLELLRVMFSFGPLQNDGGRKLLSVVLGLFDISRGEWKNGLFSFLGYFGNNMVILSVVFKLLRDTWLLIEPQLAKRIRLDVYMASKSIFIGFWLRMLTIFMPDFARKMFDATAAPFKALLEQINQKMETFEKTAEPKTRAAGISVKFPRIPADMIPSLDTIQSLQTVVSQPEIFCADDFQKIVAPLKVIPPARLILELMNIPMDDALLQQLCRGVDTKDLTGNLVDMLKPTVTIIPGGPADKARQATAITGAS